MKEREDWERTVKKERIGKEKKQDETRREMRRH